MKLFLMLLMFITLCASDYEKHSSKHINKELSHLNLTHKQIKKVKNILKKFRVKLREFRELKKEIDQRKKEMFIQDIFYTHELDKLNYKLDKKSHFIENNLLKEFHSILNTKQRVEFIDYFDDWEVD